MEQRKRSVFTWTKCGHRSLRMLTVAIPSQLLLPGAKTLDTSGFKDFKQHHELVT